jgi:selenium-binding protein 1
MKPVSNSPARSAAPVFPKDHRAGMATLLLVAAACSPVQADETCMSPYMPRITGQEEFVYVWTLGVPDLGDGSDKLVTIDVKPGSKTHGKVIHQTSVGGRYEAHHGGFTDDRRQLWLCGLDQSRIFIFDVHSNPAEPRLIREISDFEEKSGGAVGPHGVYALPGRVLIPCLSNATDRHGRTALVEYSNQGQFIATHWMPTQSDPRGAVIESVADGYGYDARVLPRKNVLLTTSFTGWSNYMNDFARVAGDPEAMKRFGQTMVLWDFHARQPRKVFHVPGSPLEIRWASQPANNYAFTATALTSKLWLVYEDPQSREWHAKAVADIGDAAKLPLPVDISLSADDSTLFVDCFGDGTLRVFDVSNPHQPRQTYEEKIGRQVNMLSQSWDGKRLYFTTSLLARWDKLGDDNEQFFKAYHWDGRRLQHQFTLDFTQLRLGRPHHMLFGSTRLFE